MQYTTKIVKKEEVAEGTVQCFFEKPENFEFIAGQFIELSHINPVETDGEGNTRAFSITRAPHEEGLSIATRMRDTAFKRILRDDQVGAEITLEGPFGNFILHEKESRPAVFLVGGIGITPFMSIIKDALYRKTGHSMYLFYSNRRPEDAAFLSELRELDSENSNFTLIATMTDMDQSKEQWEGETGYITADMIEKYAEIPDAVYYTAGPAEMVGAMRKLLNNMGVSNDDIKTEEFSGY